MFALAYENSKSNIKNLKYIADTYDDLATIPAEELSFGALCKVIETGDIYKLNSDGEWIRQLNGQGGGNDSGLPALGEYDTGSVLVSVDGEWKVLNQGSNFYQIFSGMEDNDSFVEADLYIDSEDQIKGLFITIDGVQLSYTGYENSTYGFYGYDYSGNSYYLSFSNNSGGFNFYVYDYNIDTTPEKQYEIYIGYANISNSFLPKPNYNDVGKTLVVKENDEVVYWSVEEPFGGSLSNEQLAYNAEIFVNTLINDSTTTSALLASDQKAVSCYLYDTGPEIVV